MAYRFTHAEVRVTNKIYSLLWKEKYVREEIVFHLNGDAVDARHQADVSTVVMSLSFICSNVLADLLLSFSSSLKPIRSFLK